MPLLNADVADSQRMSIFSACVQTNESSDDYVPANAAELMTHFKYESISTVLRRCDRSKFYYSGHIEESLSGNNATMANNGSYYRINGRFRRNNRSSEEIANMKKASMS